MKKINIILGLILIISSCSESEDHKFKKEFDQTFGKEKSIIIEEIVDYGNLLLMRAYDSNTKEEAYKSFILDLQKNQIDSLELHYTKSQVDSFVNLFEKSNIKHDIFKFWEMDSIERYIFDADGKFMSVLNEFKETNKLAYNYYDSYKYMGQLQYTVLAKGVLKDDVNLDDYLTERIIIIDFLYRYMTLKQLTQK